MNIVRITAQDFSTTDLIEALKARGHEVLTAEVKSAIERSATAIERERCALVADRNAALAASMAADARRDGEDADATLLEYGAKVATAIALAIRAEPVPLDAQQAAQLNAVDGGAR